MHNQKPRDKRTNTNSRNMTIRVRVRGYDCSARLFNISHRNRDLAVTRRLTELPTSRLPYRY